MKTTRLRTSARERERNRDSKNTAHESQLGTERKKECVAERDKESFKTHFRCRCTFLAG